MSSSTTLTATKPRYLVLGSGGMKGFQILGALHILDMAGYLSQIEGYSGSSVGALISLLLVCGYKPYQIISLAASTSIFADFAGVTSLAARLTEMKTMYGITSTTFIREKLEEAVKVKYGRVPTLQELYLITGLEFWTVSYDLDRERADYISRATYPEMDAVTAVLLSINIPLIFYRLTFQERTYIDGAFCDPLPFRPFDDGTRPILCIYIVTNRPVPTTPAEGTDMVTFLKGVGYFVGKLATCAIDQNRRALVAGATPAVQFIELRSDCLDTVGLSLGADDKARMLIRGADTAERYLELERVFQLAPAPIKECGQLGDSPDRSRICA
jgi:predicted acylesterase/phospholipase RssA